MKMELKKLTKSELASVRRAYKTSQAYKKIIQRLKDKVELLEDEVATAYEQMMLFEEPIKRITGGLSSEEYLDELTKNEVEEEKNKELNKVQEAIDESFTNN